MKKNFIIISILIFFILITTLYSQKYRIKDLPLKSRKWLRDEVVYIITPVEKKAFLELETDFERERFIKGFWKQRDPNPNTEENEFKKEHYERIKYANKHFGKEAPGPGWRSEMGKIYIILGQPNQVKSYINSTGIYPTIIWFYSNLGIRGIPNAFNIVFFRPDVGGEYKLYSPIRHGPAALLTNYMGGIRDFDKAYSELHNIEHEVANISLSLLPEESGHVSSPSITSEVLVHSKIPKIPHDIAYDNYAKNFLSFKGDVKVSHMENYVKNNSMIKVVHHNNEYGFVHLLIEPDKLTVEKDNDFFYTTIEIHGNIYDKKDQIVYRYSKKIPIQLEVDKLPNLQKKRFSFQDMFPLLTGEYKYNFLLMNLAGKEFTSFEGKIHVPKGNQGTKISTLIIGNRIVKKNNFKSHLKPFVFNDTQIVPSPKNDFNAFESLYIYAKLVDPKIEIKKNGSIHYSIVSLKTKQTVWEKSRPFRENTKLDFFESLSLKNISPDFYSLKIKIIDRSGNVLDEKKSNFYIAITPLSRPWVMSMPFSSKKKAQAKVFNVLGKQFLNNNDNVSSLKYFKKAIVLNKDSIEYETDYINNLLKVKKYDEAKNIIKPLLSGKYRESFLLTYAKIFFVQKRYKTAIGLFKDYINYFGTNTYVLNILGECYIRLGDKNSAIEILKKSIQKSSKQPNIKETIKKLEEIGNVQK